MPNSFVRVCDTTGLRAMGELAAQVVLGAAVSLQAHPISAEESIKLSRGLPEPMLPHNFESHIER